ncbi:MAG TPA: hypothetical protein VFZ23_00925 [Pyrinomonadaceae bacterium]
MQSLDRITFSACALLTVLLTAVSLAAQSTSPEYPTPVTSNEISGTIKARDLGDSRVTSYYYQFDGTQGDIFVNVVSRNFTGDIDIFTMNGLRPLTKIVIYADLAETETGRVIYLRKPEKMILRVQGRTPGDEAATFRVKFAGSFVASTLTAPQTEPELPSVTAKNESGIRVNSVGTIVEVIPKATPTPTEVAAATEEKREVAEQPREPEKQAQAVEKAASEEKSEAAPAATETSKRVEVVVTDNIPETTEPAPPPAARNTSRSRRRTPPATVPTDTAAAPADAAATTAPARRGRRRTPPKTSEPEQPDPLEKVNLIVLFKDGSRMERPMSEVLRFTVDKGLLTIIAKDGSIGRYSILDVAKVTIE